MAKRGVKEEICNFDAHNVSPEVRENVEELLKSKKSSFDPKVRGFLHYIFLFITLHLIIVIITILCAGC